MTTDAATHITENRIIQIVAEGNTMRPGERDHLRHCGRCRTVLSELQNDITRLRQQAASFVPAAERRFRLPADGTVKKRSRYGRQWGWATLGTVLSAALLVVFLQMGPEKRRPGLPSATPPVAEWKDPEMIQVNRLAENALPQAYLALSESLDGGYDEDFIDFLIPPLEDDSVS